MRLTSGYLYSGTLEIYCSAGGATDSRTIKENGSYWTDTTTHTCSGSFSFSNNGSSFSVNFWSDSNYYSSSGIFDKYVTCSVDGGSGYNNIGIRCCNDEPYFEFMGNRNWTFPTWSDEGGQDDLDWHVTWEGSWDIVGCHFDHAWGRST